MRDSIKGNFDDLKALVANQTKKNNFQIAVVAAITVVVIAAVIGTIVYFAKGCGCDDDFSEFEDDFDEDDFEDE